MSYGLVLPLTLPRSESLSSPDEIPIFFWRHRLKQVAAYEEDYWWSG